MVCLSVGIPFTPSVAMGHWTPGDTDPRDDILRRRLAALEGAGADATRTFVDLMKGKQIECEPKTTDRYGRTVAICRADGADLGMAMVSAGMAWAFVRYSQDYVLKESEAKAAGLGIHSHGCAPAWEWRARQRPKG